VLALRDALPIWSRPRRPAPSGWRSPTTCWSTTAPSSSCLRTWQRWTRGIGPWPPLPGDSGTSGARFPHPNPPPHAGGGALPPPPPPPPPPPSGGGWGGGPQPPPPPPASPPPTPPPPRAACAHPPPPPPRRRGGGRPPPPPAPPPLPGGGGGGGGGGRQSPRRPPACPHPNPPPQAGEGAHTPPRASAPPPACGGGWEGGRRSHHAGGSRQLPYKRDDVAGARRGAGVAGASHKPRIAAMPCAPWRRATGMSRGDRPPIA